MKKNGLLLVLIILCIAAWTAAENALTDLFDKEGSVKAYFVSEKEYEQAIAGKERIPFDASVLRCKKCEVPYDSGTNTVYLPMSIQTEGWEGDLTLTDGAGLIRILHEGNEDAGSSILEGTVYKISVVFSNRFMEGDLVFTGMPAVCISFEDGEIKAKEEHVAMISVLDPYRKEYNRCACTFHVRGNTSVLFDKKSYRVELHDSRGNNKKVSFLGLRKDDDWVLNSLSTDKTLSREKVCFDLWKRLNQMEKDPVAAPLIEYVELFMNRAYMGVYGLMYPIDRKLMGMNEGDILYKVSKWKEELELPGKLTDYSEHREVLQKGYEYASIEYPGAGEDYYNWEPLQAYQDFVFETGDLSTLTKQRISLNMENFLLHELFCEMTRAADNTWKNLYIAAYGNGRGGYTLNETIWDLNYTFGDAFKWDPDNGNTKFVPDSTDSYKLRYDRDYVYTALIRADADTASLADAKWKSWREEGIGPDLIEGMFEEQKEYLVNSGAMRRNEEKWSGSTLNDNSSIYEWIEGRFVFLDQLHGMTD